MKLRGQIKREEGKGVVHAAPSRTKQRLSLKRGTTSFVTSIPEQLST